MSGGGNVLDGLEQLFEVGEVRLRKDKTTAVEALARDARSLAVMLKQATIAIHEHIVAAQQRIEGVETLLRGGGVPQDALDWSLRLSEHAHRHAVATQVGESEGAEAASARNGDAGEERADGRKAIGYAASRTGPTLESVNSLEILTLLKPFSGEGDRMTFAEWLEKFEDFRDQQEPVWDDKLSVAKLRMYLTGDARERFGQFATTGKKYSEIKKSLLDSYASAVSRASAMNELAGCRQKARESVADFFDRLRRLVRKLNYAAATEVVQQRLFDEFLTRVRDDISFQLRLATPATLEEARSKAAAIEAAIEARNERRTTADNDELIYAMHALTTTITETNDRKRQVSGQMVPNETRSCYRATGVSSGFRGGERSGLSCVCNCLYR